MGDVGGLHAIGGEDEKKRELEALRDLAYVGKRVHTVLAPVLLLGVEPVVGPPDLNTNQDTLCTHTHTRTCTHNNNNNNNTQLSIVVHL